MIEVQLKDIVNNAAVFTTLNKNTLRARTAYKMALLFKEMQSQLDNYNVIRNSLLEKYGHYAKGDIYTFVQDENLADFNSEHEELLNEKVQLNCNKINIDELEDAKLTTEQMTALLPFIEE